MNKEQIADIFEAILNRLEAIEEKLKSTASEQRIQESREDVKSE